MKSFKKILIVACLSAFVGCASIPTVDNLKPYIEEGSYLAATMAISYGISDSDKVVKCRCIYGIAHGLRSLMGGVVPTVDEFDTTLKSFAVNDGRVYAQLVASLSTLYSREYSKIKGNPKTAMDIIESLAMGLERAAEPYANQM